MKRSHTFFVAGGFRVEVARCEDCGGDALFMHWPAGWTQSGSSQYGTAYEPEGIAWHCPACSSAKGVAVED